MADKYHKLHQPESVVIAALEEKIREAIDDGFVTFISGMAWGVDIWAAEIVLRLKANGHPIHLIAAVPYEGFERGWDDDWKRRYHAVLSAADFVKYICDHYHRGCFQIRNNFWLVVSSDSTPVDAKSISAVSTADSIIAARSPEATFV